MKIRGNVDYDKAPPVKASNDYFEMKADNNEVCFSMKVHCSSEIEARKFTDEFLRNWEIIIGLEHDPDDIIFKFEHADIVDLEPLQKSNNINLKASSCEHILFSDSVTLHVSRGKYPHPPNNFVSSPDIETMFMRYKAYREGRDKLLSMAYLILTIVQSRSETRKEAVDKYKIQREVLDKLGELTSTKGDEQEARKAPKDGMFKPLTSKERDWVISVCKLLIKQLGKYEHSGDGSILELRMADLPSLE